MGFYGFGCLVGWLASEAASQTRWSCELHKLNVIFEMLTFDETDGIDMAVLHLSRYNKGHYEPDDCHCTSVFQGPVPFDVDRRLDRTSLQWRETGERRVRDRKNSICTLIAINHQTKTPPKHQ